MLSETMEKRATRGKTESQGKQAHVDRRGQPVPPGRGQSKPRKSLTALRSSNQNAQLLARQFVADCVEIFKQAINIVENVKTAASRRRCV